MAKSSYTSTITTTGAAQLLVPASPNRVGLVIGSTAAGAITLSTEPGVAQNRGFIIGAAGPPIALSFLVHGEMVRAAWYVFANNPAQLLSVCESFDDDVFGTYAEYVRGYQ